MSDPSPAACARHLEELTHGRAAVRRMARQARLDVARLHRHRGGAAGLRPRRAEPPGARDPGLAEPVDVGLLHRHRLRFRRLGVVGAGRRARDGILHRLRGGEDAGPRQRLRHLIDLHLFRDPCAVPAPRAVLGDPGRHRAARDHDRARGRAGVGFRLGHVDLRRLPAGDRHQDAGGRGQHAEDRGQPGAALHEAPLPRDQRTARAEVPGAPAGSGDRQDRAVAHAADARPGAGRDRGPGLRSGFRAGDLRHHAGPVHRLHEQHLRDPGPARAVLRTRRHGSSLRLPEVCAGAGADLHRAEDLLEPGVRKARPGDRAGGDDDADRRRGGGVAVQDAAGAAA